MSGKDDLSLGLAAVMHNRRNHFGVKDSANMWRTIGGEIYPHYTTVFDDGERLAAYRAAGIRARRFGEEIFVHHADGRRAFQVDIDEQNKGRAKP